MPRKDLHRYGERAEQAPGGSALAQPSVDRQEDERNPCHRGQVRQVARRDAQEVRGAEHQDGRRNERGERVQTPLHAPQVHESAEHPDVERDAPVHGERQRQRHEQPIGRIKQRRLHAAEEWRPGKDMRIPQRQVALGELAEAELPPWQELKRQVGVDAAQHPLRGRHERVEKHGQAEQGQAAEPGPR